MASEIKVGQVWRRTSAFGIGGEVTATIVTVGRVSIEIEGATGKVFVWQTDRFLREWELVTPAPDSPEAGG